MNVQYVVPGRRAAGTIALVLLLALSVAAWPSATAYAAPASIERDFECGVFDGEGKIQRGTNGRIEVVPPRGVTTLLCIGREEPPARGALVLDHASTGEFCTVTREGAFVQTTRWHAVVTPGGVSVLVCHSEPPGKNPPGRR